MNKRDNRNKRKIDYGREEGNPDSIDDNEDYHDSKLKREKKKIKDSKKNANVESKNL